MKALAQYAEIVEKELHGLNFPESPDQLYEPLRYFLKLGGKRVRPILTLLATCLLYTSDAADD